MCVFRKTDLTDDAHVEFSKRLGELDNVKRYLSGRKLRYDHVELFDAGNLDEENNIIDPNSPRAHQNRGNGVFHVDSSFNPRRASFSLLRAVVLPPPETGGNTDFADSRTAWDDLDEGVKKELLGGEYVGSHSMAHSRKLGSPEFFKDVDAEKAPHSRHKIAQLHEPSGRMTLYVGAHMHHIEGEGVTPERSAELVKMLNEHATQEKYRVSVAWHQPGDMVIWDNRCVLHRAGKWTGGGKYKRDMRRTTVHDDSPTAWGVNPQGTEMPGPSSWAKSMVTPAPAAVKV